MTPLQRPSPNTKPLRYGDIVLAVRADGMLVDDRAIHDHEPGWQIAYCRRSVHFAAHTIGVYRTHAETDAALEDARDVADRYGDANDLLHPIPHSDLALRLVHDGQGMVTLHPDDRTTQDFVKLRPAFFISLVKSIPTGHKLTPHHLRSVAATIAQRVSDRWREVGVGCRVEVGKPTPIVIVDMTI